jgi:hypothetical protein
VLRGVAWCLLRPRTWVALAAATVATLLASGDERPGWTLAVGVSTFGLALLSMRAQYLDGHPDRPTREERRQARIDAWAAETLRRYRGEPEPVAPTRHEREVAEIVRRYEERVEARRAALKRPPSPE